MQYHGILKAVYWILLYWITVLDGAGYYEMTRKAFEGGFYHVDFVQNVLYFHPHSE